MDFPFSFGQYSSLLLIFFFHGVVFTGLVTYYGFRNSNASQKWLGVLLFLCTLYICPYMLGYANWYSGGWTRETLFFLPLMQVLVIGPVVYFYTKSLLNKSSKFSKKDWLHFVPGFLYLGYSLVVFVTDKLVLDSFYFYADGRDKDLADWYQVCGVVSMSFYLVMSLRYYLSYKRLIFAKVSYADSIRFTWIQHFLIAFLSIIVLRVLLFLLNPEWNQFGNQFWHYLSFAGVAFYISVNGYTNAIRNLTLVQMKMKEVDVFQEEDKAVPAENGNSKISTSELENWKKNITHLMAAERLFENPRLTLSDVAKSLNTNTKMVSIVVNEGFQMNFNDFVNHHRIEEVKKRIKNGDHQQNTLLGIALNSGFNSKATFNRAFKKGTGISPKEFVDSVA